MVRPHPIFWRVLMGAFCLYGMYMTYLLLLDVDEARQALKYFDSGLGEQLAEVSYADDCRLYTPENPDS